MKFVEDIRNAAKWWSLRFLTLAATVQAAWETMPPEALAVVPQDWRGPIVLGLIVLAGVARVIKQDLPQ
jgi:hypothetical protein